MRWITTAAVGLVLMAACLLLVYAWMHRQASAAMDATTLVRVSLDPGDSLLTSADLRVCGSSTHFTRAELLDTAWRNVPTWEYASKCPVEIVLHSDRAGTVTYVLDSIEYRSISGEHAFTLGPDSVTYHYWP